MRRFTTVVLAALVLLSILTVGLGGASSAAPQSQETTTGISLGPASESEINNLEDIRSTLEQFGVEPPSETMVLTTPDGNRHLVFSSNPIPAGKATVKGRTFSTGDISGTIIVADEFEVETTGKPVSFNEVRTNPQQFDYELIRFDAATAVSAVATKPSSAVSSQQSYGYFTESGTLSSDIFQEQPGKLASWAALSESNSSVQRSGGTQPQFPDASLQGISFSQQFWGEGDATVDAAVVPVYRHSGDGAPTVTGRQLVIVDVNYDSQTLDSPADIRGGSHDGEVVTVTSDIVGSSTSAQEYLTSVASCGEKTVSVPMSPPACVPVTHDLVVHSGVLVDGTSPGEVPIAYAGVSNTIQHTRTKTESGRYKITGEVVRTSEIDSSLESGYALRVFEMERVGVASIEGDFQANAEQLEQRIKAQLELNESEWGEQSEGGTSGDSGESNTGSGGESEPSTGEPYVKSTELRTDAVEAGNSFDVWVDVWNPSNEMAEKEVTISAGGEVVKTKTVSVGTVRSQIIVKAAVSDPGTYEITVNGKSAGEIEVLESSSEDDGSGTSQADGPESGAVGSFLSSQNATFAGALLAFISIAVFLLGVVLEIARSFKSRSSGEEPNLTERMTEGVIATSMVGFLVSGVLGDDGLGFLLLLFGAVGIVSFAARHVIDSVLRPRLNAVLRGDSEWSRSVAIIAPIVLVLGGMGVLSLIFSATLSGSLAAAIVKYTFGLLSSLVVVFGLIVGAFRFYKKYLSEAELNTSGDVGLGITVIGGVSMITAGLLSGESFGGGFIGLGGIALVGCLLVTVGKTIYQIV